MEDKKIIKVLVKEPYKSPYVKEIEDKLKNLQEIVGGYIVRGRIFFINTKFGNSLSCVYFEASMVNII